MQDDLGAPLIQDNVVIGILSSVPDEVRRSVLFVDLFKSAIAIDDLIRDHVVNYKDTLPRKKARYNRIAFRSGENKHKYNSGEFKYEGTSNEEVNHVENNHKETNH